MADRHVTGQRAQFVFVEDLGDQSGVAHGGDVAALAGGDAGRLLTAMLERVQAEVGQARNVVSGCEDSEDATFVSRSIAVRDARLGQVGKPPVIEGKRP